MRQKVALGSVSPGWVLRRYRKGSGHESSRQLPLIGLGGPSGLAVTLPGSQDGDSHCVLRQTDSHTLTVS